MVQSNPLPKAEQQDSLTEQLLSPWFIPAGCLRAFG